MGCWKAHHAITNRVRCCVSAAHSAPCTRVGSRPVCLLTSNHVHRCSFCKQTRCNFSRTWSVFLLFFNQMFQLVLPRWPTQDNGTPGTKVQKLGSESGDWSHEVKTLSAKGTFLQPTAAPELGTGCGSRAQTAKRTPLWLLGKYRKDGETKKSCRKLTWCSRSSQCVCVLITETILKARTSVGGRRATWVSLNRKQEVEVRGEVTVCGCPLVSQGGNIPTTFERNLGLFSTLPRAFILS